jgi:peptide/nickel transport system permease protein
MGSRWAFGGVFALGLVAVVGPMVAAHDPLASDVARALQPPSAVHPFGTDALGRDVLARVLAAARLDLGLALAAVGLAAPLGTVVGAAAGLWGDGASRLALRSADVLTALPIYADNATALAGGLIAGDVYKTATGELRIVV